MGTTPKVLMQEPITQTEFHNTEERLFETIDVLDEWEVFMGEDIVPHMEVATGRREVGVHMLDGLRVVKVWGWWIST